MLLFDYIYYRLYLLGRTGGSPRVNKSSVTIIFGALQFWNFLTLSLFVAHFYKFDFEMPKIFAFIVVFLTVFNFFGFYRRHNKIEARFERESIRRRKIGYIVAVGYVLFTFLSVFMLEVFIPKAGNNY